MGFKEFFSPESVAVIGVSRSPEKVGHVVFRNLIEAGFAGDTYAINPKAEEVLGKKAFASVLDVPGKIDLAVVCVPAETVLKITEECGRKRIKNMVVISGGFKEIGNVELEEKLAAVSKKFGIRVIGPNCLGNFDAHSKLDTLFLPRYRLKRPKEGGISFITQSGAIGSAILDYATEQGYGFAKFVSYGNAMDVDESDLLEFFAQDHRTKVICAYIEGVKNGRKFLETAKKVRAKKPVVIIKGGITEEGSKAVASHTGSLAGTADAYFAAFKQAGIIKAESLVEMFDYARLFEKSVAPKGNRIQIITNGGGYGIIAADAVIKSGLHLAQLGKQSVADLRKKLPPLISIRNPLDLIGDANIDRYKNAIEACINDDNVDALLVIALYQTPLLSTDVVDVITEANHERKKPIAVVSTGGEFTEVLSKDLEENGVTTFDFPENAVKALKQLAEYYSRKRK